MSFNTYLLAAGNNSVSRSPCSLWSLHNGKSILQWQIQTIEAAMPNAVTQVIVGYDHQQIIEHHPHLSFKHVLNWEKTGALQTFLEAGPDPDKPCLITYGDTIFHTKTLNAIASANSDVIIAVDSVWKKRFESRSPADIQSAETINLPPLGCVEYTGLLKLSPTALSWLLTNQIKYKKTGNFITLINDLKTAGFHIQHHDVQGEWAEMNEPNDLIHFVMGNKAETLLRIQPRINKSIVCDQITCSWNDWCNKTAYMIKQIQIKFPDQSLIIRSSSPQEDSWETANAGVYDTQLDVNSNSDTEVQAAVDSVFAAYGKNQENTHVLIQPFISNVAMSGVIFTCDLSTGAPYYTINYDDSTGKTDTITSGKPIDSKTIVIYKQFDTICYPKDPRIESIITAARELENILGYDKLDIEFAIGHSGEIYTFQVRPIVVPHTTCENKLKQLHNALITASQQYRRWQKKPPHVFGEFTIFSGMSDWNPAEIIGNRPSPLAVSLYHHLITKDVWAQQRAEFGYRDIRPSPLVHTFCGQPYVDCRASINSFIPGKIDDDLASRLAQTYLELLKARPQLHDKIELDILFTIWTPTFKEDARKQFHGKSIDLNDLDTLELSLKEITAHALTRLEKDVAPIRQLTVRRQNTIQSNIEIIEKIYLLIEDCKKFGTIAFAHAARAGFVAITLLKSLVRQGSLSSERMLAFQASIPTVAGELQQATSDSSIHLTDLIKEFGHLRPGTYDINQPAYWEKPDFYLNQKHITTPDNHNQKFEFSDEEQASLQRIIDQLSVDISVQDFVQYLINAIQLREKVKFEFSKNLSLALDHISQYATETLNISREDAQHLSYDDICGLRSGQIDTKDIIAYIRQRQVNHATQQLARLPGLIQRESDFLRFEQTKAQANFINLGSVIAELIFLENKQPRKLAGKIVAIPNADPGYDWLFSHQIAGLVTQFGGANSHMAIRCAELGIPAAIGIGEKHYSSLKQRRILLDCQQEKLEHA